MEDEKKKHCHGMTRTDWLLVAVLAVSVADFVTRLVRG